MIGPDHYRAAIDLLDTLTPVHSRDEALAAAQVHATLALAAATAMAAYEGGMHRVDFRAWDDVCGVEPG